MARVRQNILNHAIDGLEIAIMIRRSRERTKTISLSVNSNPESDIKLLVPWDTSEKDIADILAKQEDWIRRTYARIERELENQRWNTGKTIEFRGAPIKLVVGQLRKGDRHNLPVHQLSLDGKELRILLPYAKHGKRREAEIRDAVRRWYKEEANTHLPARMEEWLPPWRLLLKERDIHCADTDDGVPDVKISDARTRWGSCSVKRVIRLSWRVMGLPDHLADYVIVHELVHLKEMNHQRGFWQLVEALIPNCRERRKELREWGRDRVV